MKTQQERLDLLIQKLDELHTNLVSQEHRFKVELDRIDINNRTSALNLHHYLALRRQDVRPLQMELSDLGLSSLGRSEACVLHSVETVRSLVARLAGRTGEELIAPATTLTFSAGRELLRAHTESLLGPRPTRRDVHIMVTMPAEAGSDPELIHRFVESGMNCMRINCAHDDPETWQRMIAHLRQAESELGRTCKIMMDLGGPKLRTGPVQAGPSVLRIRPVRDSIGVVDSPVRIWMTNEDASSAPHIPASPAVPCSSDWLQTLDPGDAITMKDARRSRRELRITAIDGKNRWAECDRSLYLVPGISMHRKGDRGSVRGHIGNLPPKEGSILLKVGDLLDLTRSLTPGSEAIVEERGEVAVPARIGCTLPEAFVAVKVGEPIWFDDGKIGGEIIAADSEEIRVSITQARPGGSRLRAEKGINLPESKLRIPALTPKDREDLVFVAKHADIVGFSFVSEASDVRELQDTLAAAGAQHVGIVLKIETRRAFANLPQLLFAAMRSPCAGIMIARGDLAIECGYERLAEVQEEILWIAEAAHLPVIWATQVLETLARTGVPSRSEITDAAMGQRAECVMLNKGPYIVEAIQLLDNILHRMQAHQSKKRSLLRQLRSWTKEPALL